MDISQCIIEVLLRHESPLPKNATDRNEEGALKVLGLICRAVKNNMPIRMALLDLPFKSPNSVDKVLGTLPDMAENLALAHLNGFCAVVRETCTPGATSTIVSYGWVYKGRFNISFALLLDATVLARPRNNLEDVPNMGLVYEDGRSNCFREQS